MSKLGSIFNSSLAPFWTGFGSQIGAKSAQNRCQHRFTRRTTKWYPIGWPQDRFLVDLGLHFGSPRGSPEMLFGPFVRSLGHLGAPWRQDGLKTPPKRLPGWIWVPTWSIFDGFWVDFGSQVGPKIDPQSIEESMQQHNYQPINQSTNQPISQSTNQPSIPGTVAGWP